MDVAVVIPFFGTEHLRGRRYRALLERAVASVDAQTVAPAEVIIARSGVHVSDCRNRGAASASSEWLCFLDADDELEPGYLEAMAKGSADLRGPATVFVKRTGREGPLLVPMRDLETENNYLVIGTLIRHRMFFELGGFRAWPVHEDYDLWLRAARAGASIEQLADAVYVVHEASGTRNRKPLSYKRRVNDMIRQGAEPGEPNR